MKKILASLFLSVVFMCGLCACSINSAFFSKKILKENLVPDLPEITFSKAKKEDNKYYYYKATEEDFNLYVKDVYGYLKSLDFKYFGTRGEELSNFFGGAPTYAFIDGSELSDFKYTVDRDGNKLENCYVFVWANEILAEFPNVHSYYYELIYFPDREYNVILKLNYGLETYHLSNGEN